MFLIPIRNKTTGEEKNFFGPQEIANFLGGREDASDWTGWEFMGKLPAADAPEVAAEAPAAEEPPAATPEPTHDAANESLLQKLEHAVEAVIHGEPATEPPAA